MRYALPSILVATHLVIFTLILSKRYQNFDKSVRNMPRIFINFFMQTQKLETMATLKKLAWLNDLLKSYPMHN